ncbi:hypothetical protein [Dietzia psychralcaliphila]|uniref:hypothetical protein n=1 Tax=Dietzia psychralcaliphila TaxID=139021 RepID=UPI001C1E05F4|nr:hypothetical protein [Dietzia psychralcaliphila]
MDLIDVMEVGRELMPRKWKRYVIAPVVAVTALLRPDLVQQAVSWLGQQFSQRYMEIVTSPVISDVAFSQLG